jgi:hypothetical protein
MIDSVQSPYEEGESMSRESLCLTGCMPQQTFQAQAVAYAMHDLAFNGQT